MMKDSLLLSKAFTRWCFKDRFKPEMYWDVRSEQAKVSDLSMQTRTFDIISAAFIVVVSVVCVLKSTPEFF